MKIRYRRLTHPEVGMVPRSPSPGPAPRDPPHPRRGKASTAQALRGTNTQARAKSQAFPALPGHVSQLTSVKQGASSQEAKKKSPMPRPQESLASHWRLMGIFIDSCHPKLKRPKTRGERTGPLVRSSWLPPPRDGGGRTRVVRRPWGRGQGLGLCSVAFFAELSWGGYQSSRGAIDSYYEVESDCALKGLFLECLGLTCRN